jgi:hypothetical protein
MGKKQKNKGKGKVVVTSSINTQPNAGGGPNGKSNQISLCIIHDIGI